MKYAFVVITILLLFLAVGYSKTATSASSDLFTYLSYEDGRIIPYKVVDGLFKNVEGTETKVGLSQSKLAVDIMGRKGYVADLGGAITCFTINADGNLSAPQKFDTGIKDYIAEIIVDPSGKYLYASISGHNSDNITGGAIAQFPIESNGILTVDKPILINSGCAASSLVIVPSGKFLYVGHNGGVGGIIGYYIGDNGIQSAMPADYTSGIASQCTEMAVTDDGSNLFVGDDKDLKLKRCSIDAKGCLTLIAAVSFPEGFDTGGIQSIAVDKCGNVMIVTPSRYLSTYKMDNGILRSSGDFICLKDGRILSKDEIDPYLKGTSEYSQAYEKRANQDAYNREKYALMETRHKLCSQLNAIRTAPDGFVYVSSTSGVYRFISTDAGLLYSGKATAWPDTLDKIRDKNTTKNVRKSLTPRKSGMIFISKAQ